MARFAVLFDMDGVLVLSNPAHLAAWQAFAREELGLEITREMFYSTISGRKNEEALAELFPGRFSPEERARISRAKEAFYRERFGPQLQPVPGVLALVRELRAVAAGGAAGQGGASRAAGQGRTPGTEAEAGAAGAKFKLNAGAAEVALALATSGPPENAEFVLRQFGTREAFPMVVTAEDVRQSKPDPTIYLLAAERAGAAPERCVVLEDSVAGVQAAKRAGMHCLAVATSEPAEKLAQAGADWVRPDFRGVGWPELRALLTRKGGAPPSAAAKERGNRRPTDPRPTRRT